MPAGRGGSEGPAASNSPLCSRPSPARPAEPAPPRGEGFASYLLDLRIKTGAPRAATAQGGGPGGPAWAGGMSGGSCGGRFTASLRQTLPSILRFRRHCAGEEGAPRADRLPLAFGPWTEASRKPPSPDPPTPGIYGGPVP